MIYSEDQYFRLQYLLRKYRIYELSDNEINELKDIVKILQPNIDDFKTEEVVVMGLIIVGSITILNILDL